MSDEKKRDRALQRRVRERMEKTGESYQAAYQQLIDSEPPTPSVALPTTSSLLDHRHRRIPLPLSTEVPIRPGQSAEITAHSQVARFWPDRLLIKNASSWTIEQLTVESKDGLKTSLVDVTDKGEAFSYLTWQPLPAHEARCGDAIVLVATYRGDSEKGECFEAALFGWENHLPAKAPKLPSSTHSSKRISECATSKEARPAETIQLPWTITSPSLFVDRVAIAYAKDWIINDIRVRGKSIFVQSGDVPAVMFSDNIEIVLEPLKEGDLVYIIATYIGRKPSARLALELSGTKDAPNGKRTLSYFLPLSTGIPVEPTQSAQITARPQTPAFLPERIVIADSANWVINDIKVGNASRFAQAGDVPALAFDSLAIGSHVMFGPVHTAQDFIIVITRVPSGDERAPFFCGVQGRVLPSRIVYDDDVDDSNVNNDQAEHVASYKSARLVLPINPNADNAHRVGTPIDRILPNQKTRIGVRPIHGAFTIGNLLISNAGTLGGSADWIVNDLEINGRSQRVPKDMPGTLFGSSGVARVSFAGLDVVECDQEIALTVTYVGLNPEGCPFFAAITGSRPPPNPTVIPIAIREPIQPTRKMTIRVREQSGVPFRVERFIIEDGNTEGGSADWIVNDLRVGNRSQFQLSGDVPGDIFATNAIGTFVKFDPWPPNASIEIDVTYRGLREEGALFHARIEGTVVRDDYSVAPPDLNVRIETGQGPGDVVIATCEFRPPATSSSMP